ncbi:MAG: NgoPII family restriction endonuclease [Flavobacterium sp.]|uniref:NgoPII family restriction endonuclease n=1 Tax=Flavobacterium sp. TaxID=239 RepID=UPI00352986EE
MKNILDAIVNISIIEDLTINEITFGNNRANNMGEGLESFIKDAFTNTFLEDDKNIRLKKYNEVFSYQGSKNNPPDLMLKNGDALEIQKVESLTTDLQLNSSYPKAKLFSNSTLINNHCKKSEEWTEKDFIYTIGHIPKGTNKLSSLWFVYGSIYAADENCYISVKNSLTEGLEKKPDINFSETNEIGRVNFVDPLKITNLRVRGMWLLQPPYKVFKHIHNYSNDGKFQCFLLIPEDKYYKLPKDSRDRIEGLTIISIEDVKVENPNNPADLINIKFITYKQT